MKKIIMTGLKEMFVRKTFRTKKTKKMKKLGLQLILQLR